jgi:UDP-glucuronate 4-epimerase
MANYLVTGAAGFIASQVAQFLLDEGHHVIGLDNLNDAYDVRMKEYRLAKLKQEKGFSFYPIDISDWSAIKSIESHLDDIEAVINLAARAGVRASVVDPWVYVDTNVTGTLNLLEISQRKGISKFLLASTSSIYGQDAPLPTPETAPSDFPLQAYAASKKGAEAMCHAYHYLYNIDVSIVRFFTVFGPAGRPDMSVFRFIRWIIEGDRVQLFGDGEQTRGFTYIDDIARGVIQALKPVGFEIINLGGHQNISMNDLIALIESKVGKSAAVDYLPAARADMTANLADVTKAGELLGWEPVISLEDGIDKTIQWYLQNREWAQDLDLNL